MIGLYKKLCIMISMVKNNNKKYMMDLFKLSKLYSSDSWVFFFFFFFFFFFLKYRTNYGTKNGKEETGPKQEGANPEKKKKIENATRNTSDCSIVCHMMGIRVCTSVNMTS